MIETQVQVTRWKTGKHGYLPKVTGRSKLVKTYFKPKNEGCQSQSGIQSGSFSLLPDLKIRPADLINWQVQMPWHMAERQAALPIVVASIPMESAPIERMPWVGCAEGKVIKITPKTVRVQPKTNKMDWIKK